MAERSVPPVPVSPTLVGRDRELAALRAALAVALTGHGSLVLIGGAAGLGKTTLAEALLAEAPPQGALVLVGRCYDLSETPPYGPWAEALARAPRGNGLPALPTALLQPERDDGEALASQDAIIRRVQAYLAALAAAQPLVLLLDDLHWADPASRDLLRAVARDLAALPLVLLATYRMEEVDRDHPLHTLLPLLVREARAERLDLRPLDATATNTLVRARYALGEGDRARLVAYLAGRTEGNALFLGELLRTLEGEGTLHRVANGWQLGNLEQVPVPPLLRQVIEGRIARLDRETERLLTVAAVVGQEVSLRVWAAVGGVREDDLLDHAERAVEARLLLESPDGTGVRFAHALIRETLYEATSALRRRALHRQAGEGLIATPQPDPDAVAFHLRQAGDQRAVEWLVRAGERALRAYAWLTAVGRYEAALALLSDVAASARARALLLMTLAQLRRYAEPGSGIPLVAEAERLARDAGDRVLAAAARFDRGHLAGLAGDPLVGLAEMERAWPDLARLDAPARAQLPALRVQGVAPEEDYHRGVLVLYLTAAGRYQEALTYGEPFLGRAPGTTPRGLQGIGLACAMLGQLTEAWRAYADARAAYLAAGQYREVGNTLMQELDWAVHYRADDRAYLARLAAEGAHAFVRASGVVAETAPHLAGMPLLWVAGRWSEALTALAVLADSPLNRPNLRPWLGRILRARGEWEAAWALLRESQPDGPSGMTRTEFLQALALQRLAAVLSLDTGDLPAARTWLDAHDRLLAGSGAVLGQAEGQLGWAEYHRALGDLARARQHAEQALADADTPRQPLALLAAHRFLGEIDIADGLHSDAAAHLDTALARADACAAPYERALTLLALAELRAAEGKPNEARAALDEARDLLMPLEARPALARADALATRLAAPIPPAPAALPFGLTTREADVLRLLAEGLTDAQIGARLFVSRNTVNTHTRAIYGKLGVTSRAAAARLATEHSLR